MKDKSELSASTTDKTTNPYQVYRDSTVTDAVLATDGKRKASDELSSPTANKRIKHDESAEPEKKPTKVPAIPFPEKVCQHRFDRLPERIVASP